MKKILIALGLVGVMALSSISASADGPDYCFAERPCKEGYVACMVYGPDCDAYITDEGVRCIGRDEQGKNVDITDKCEQ